MRASLIVVPQYAGHQTGTSRNVALSQVLHREHNYLCCESEIDDPTPTPPHPTRTRVSQCLYVRRPKPLPEPLAGFTGDA